MDAGATTGRTAISSARASSAASSATGAAAGSSTSTGAGADPVRSAAILSCTSGRARRGANSVVQLRGGGVVHGPVQRSHKHSINKKVKSLGLKSALSSKMKDGKILIFDKLDCNGKTSKLRQDLKKLELENALIIHNEEASDKFTYALKNIPNIDLLEEMGTNVYDILKRDKLVLTVKSLKKIEERLK